MESPAFKHKVKIQIRFSDVDRLNHVNNACYHTYMELGRVHYLNEILERSVDWEERGFILARTEIDYVQPLFLGDEVWCYTRVDELGNKSMRLQHQIVKRTATAEEICARATGVLVAMDYRAGKSIVLPNEWRDRIKNYEAG